MPTDAERVEKAQAEMNRWLKAREALGPETCHAIAEACRHAAIQYRKDMEATHGEGTERIAEAFHKQAVACENIVYHLEL